MSSTIDENQQFIDPLTSTPIVNGYIYIGANGLDAELNAITIYSDRDLITPLSNPQRTDSSGRSVNKIWVPGRYSMKITDSADVQKLNDLDLGELAAIGTTKLTNVQGSDIITAEASPTITTLTDGQLYVLTTVLANAGAVTLQIDATPTYPIKKNHDVALVANDLESSQMIVVAWNSTDSVFELQGSTANDARTDPQAVTHDITSDADYTLTAAQELYGRTIITDTGTNLTTGRNIICSTTERGYYFQNDTAQTLTFKTSAGTGIALLAGTATYLICDGTNVVIPTTGLDVLTVNGVLTAKNSINEAKGSDIATAATTDIGAATGNLVDLTGNATITGLGTVQAGAERVTRTTGTPTFTYNATSLILPGNANITAKAGDIQTWRSLGSGNWIMINYLSESSIPQIESGTWTPTLQDSSFSDGEGQTYNIQTGHYTKIGNRVFINGFLQVTSIGTLTTGDNAFIGGLPFTSNSTANTDGGVCVFASNNLLTFTHPVSGIINPNTDYIALQEGTSTGTSGIGIVDITGSGGLQFFGQYII